MAQIKTLTIGGTTIDKLQIRNPDSITSYYVAFYPKNTVESTSFTGNIHVSVTLSYNGMWLYYVTVKNNCKYYEHKVTVNCCGCNSSGGNQKIHYTVTNTIQAGSSKSTNQSSRTSSQWMAYFNVTVVNSTNTKTISSGTVWISNNGTATYDCDTTDDKIFTSSPIYMNIG